MKRSKIWIGSMGALALVLSASSGAAGEGEGLSERIRTAMASEARPAAEATRDKNRKPVETLAFLEVHEKMDVLELVPGGGWYSRLLAPSLAGTGSLSVWMGVDRYVERFAGLGLDSVTVIAPEAKLQPTDLRGIYDLPAVDFGREAFDAVLTFRNIHNLTAEARANANRAVFEALRPGGVYGVVDHTRRHMQPDSPENRRRLDPVLVIHEIEAAGFEFEAFSELHYRLDDELRYEVGRRSVSGNTDRFTLRFRKPR